MTPTTRPFAVVTGASTGIGYELAKCCAEDGFDLLVAADEPEIEKAADAFRRFGGKVDALQADLATEEGVQRLYDAAAGRPVDALLANAGRGLGGAFLDQDLQEARLVLDTNVTGTIYLIHKIGNDMRRRGAGRILITGSIAGFIPGSFQAVYNGTKAFLDSFAAAIRNELKYSGVTVTCLMPGATETEFFERADMTDTKVGQAKKDDARRCGKGRLPRHDVRRGGDRHGWKNKLQVAAAHVMPSTVLAEQHRKTAQPGGGRK